MGDKKKESESKSKETTSKEDVGDKKKTKKKKSKRKTKETTSKDEEQPVVEAPIAEQKQREDNDDDNVSKPPFRQWLFDRIDGKSDHKGITSRPPCRMCWVPPPVRFCPSLVEDNSVCKYWGQVGCVDSEHGGEKHRSTFMKFGFFTNLIAFLCTLYACTSIHIGSGAIQTAAFSSCSVSEIQNFTIEVATIDIGLRGIVLDLPEFPNLGNGSFFPFGVEEGVDDDVILARREFFKLGGLQVIDFDSFCVEGQNVPDIDLYVKDGECEACKDISSSIVVSLLMSTISFVPTLSTDVLRMYYNYDVNCQKFFATFFAFFTMIMSLNTLIQYNMTCFESFYEGDISYDKDRMVIPNPVLDRIEPTFVLRFDWHMGTGLICLYAGTILKVFDIIVNVIVPTPTITRNEEEQADYEQQHSIRVQQQQESERAADSKNEENPN